MQRAGACRRCGEPFDRWRWLGGVGGDGYGMTSLGRRSVKAHRAAWFLATGSMPGNLSVCHHCDTPLCVRPTHLFLGTPADNNRDRNQKERQARGERISRLTESDIREIRASASVGGTFRGIARERRMTARTIRLIVRRETWRHVA
jgi:hypothetical protein